MKKFQILFAMLFALATIQSTNAQSNKSDRIKDAKSSTTIVSYTCPMHPQETSDKPGKCSKCGMALNLSKKELMKAGVVKYACTMHPEVTSDKPGQCSKCGKNLNLSKKEQMKMEVMNGYRCPMHADVTSDKPGKCSKCGMALTAVKPTTKD
ncbi:MAG: heavy metal-binding domain-containing protein [Bacteroidota bacterium]